MGNRWRRSGERVTPASLRAESIIEIGCATGTSFLYVLTKKKLHVLHTSGLPDRKLDDYAISLAVNWIENGMPSYEVASNFGISEPTLRYALAAAGYERLTLPAASKGNRRGKLVHVGVDA